MKLWSPFLVVSIGTIFSQEFEIITEEVLMYPQTWKTNLSLSNK